MHADRILERERREVAIIIAVKGHGPHKHLVSLDWSAALWLGTCVVLLRRLLEMQLEHWVPRVGPPGVDEGEVASVSREQRDKSGGISSPVT